MNEQGRADGLARAIEELLQGRTPGDLDDEDLNDLLRMAKLRWDAARSAAHAGAQHEGTIWQQVLVRLGRLHTKQTGRANAADPPKGTAARAPSDEPELYDFKELRGVMDLRRQMAAHSASLAEEHREAVWKQVQARIQTGSTRGGFFFLPRSQRAPQVLASAVDSMVLGEPIWEAGDSRLEELLDLARTRRAMAQLAAAAGSQQCQGRLWARLRPRLLAQLLGPSQPDRGAFRSGTRAWPKLAAAGATVALILAALGPIPATGLADHPLAQLARFVGEHVGVSETASPPVVPPAADIVEASDVTASQASELLGLPAREPTFMPAGFRLVSSKFFPQPLTAGEGGVFLLAYAAAPSDASAGAPTILIYQEHASGSDIAAQPGSVQDLTLSDGTPATYVEGSWSASGSLIVWGADGSQTLVLERGGLRTIIHHINGPRLDPNDLLAIAERMAPAPAA